MAGSWPNSGPRPLVNLDKIRSARGELIALPLNVIGISGAPCRAIFVES